MRAKYFRFLSQANSALKITLAISVPNLVKIGEKLHLLSLTKEKNFVILEVNCRTCALIKSALATNVTVRAPFIWSLHSKFGEDRLKIEGARYYRMHRLRCDPARAYSNTVTHTRALRTHGHEVIT